jgi:hypothetical protein
MNNVILKHRLVSCSTQTHSKENIKNFKNKRMPSLKDLKLKINNFQFFNNNDINYKISNNLKGKKILKKKKILDIYNSLYNSNSILSTEKKENQKINHNKSKHKKGEIALSFTGNDSLNKIIITEMNIIKKNNFQIYKKIPDNISNINENKYPLLNKQIYKLPLYNVRKILTNNMNKNNLLNCHNNNDNEQLNKFEDLKVNSESIKENFPLITNNKNFDSTDIKKENQKILKDLFKRNCLNKKKINKNILRYNCLNKRAFDGNKLYNLMTQENNKYNNNNTKDLIESNIGIKINTELNSIKNKAKKLFIINHNKTSDNMILSNDF